MKSEETELIISANDLFANLNIKCTNDQPIKYYCCSRNCWEDSILCQKQNCTCQKTHSKCANLLKAHIVHQQLNTKILNQKIPLMIQMIDKSISKIIDHVSEMKDQLQKKLKLFGLNKIQYEIVQSIQNKFKVDQSSSNAKVPGSLMNKYVRPNGQNEKKWFQDSFTRYKDIISSYRSKINFFLEQVQNTIAAFHSRCDCNFQLHKGFVTSKIYPNPIQAVRINSPYLPQLTYLQSKMKYLLEPITSIRQIFSFKKATETFDPKRFTQSLQGKSKLLFLFEKPQQKRIGFYIPLKIQSSMNEKVYLSNSKAYNSFIFNLDKKEGEEINSKSYFIFNKDNGQLALKKFSGQSQEFLNKMSGDIRPTRNNLFSINLQPSTNYGLLSNNTNTSSNSIGGLFGKSQGTNTILPQKSIVPSLFGVSRVTQNSNQSQTCSLVSGFVLNFEQSYLSANLYLSSDSGHKSIANGQFPIGQTDNIVNMEVYAFNEDIFDEKKILLKYQQENQRKQSEDYQ